MGASLTAQMVKNLSAMQRTGFDPWIRKIPWSRELLPTPLFLPGGFYGQRSQVELHSSWGHKELNMTEWLTLSLLETWVQSLGQEDPLEKAGGNPLQCSCLKDTMDGGAWWATVQRVAKSWIWLSSQAQAHNRNTDGNRDHHTKWSRSEEKEEYHRISHICGI